MLYCYYYEIFKSIDFVRVEERKEMYKNAYTQKNYNQQLLFIFDERKQPSLQSDCINIK